jgi:predicted acyl esterase
VDLWVSTTGSDADFIVKRSTFRLPDTANQPGYQMLLQRSFRGRYRNSFEKPEPFKPGEPAQVNRAARCSTVEGHRLMVPIKSTWFPSSTATRKNSSPTSTSPSPRISPRRPIIHPPASDEHSVGAVP